MRETDFIAAARAESFTDGLAIELAALFIFGMLLKNWNSLALLPHSPSNRAQPIEVKQVYRFGRHTSSQSLQAFPFTGHAVLTATQRFCRLLAPGELTECLQWALPRFSLERASWMLSQVTERVELGQTSQIIATAVSPGHCDRIDRNRLLAAAIAIPQVAGAATLLLLQAVPTAAPLRAGEPLCGLAGEVGPCEGETCDDRGELIRHVLEPILQRLRELGITFLQAACDDRDQETLLRMAGFQPLADLCLMSLPRDAFADATGRADAVAEEHRDGAAASQWVPLEAIGEHGLDIFSALATETFIQTRDCPRLSDFRTAEEIVRGYQAASTFDPSLSRLLRVGDQWAGCLVLTRHAVQASGDVSCSAEGPAVALELTYMGLVPEFRRRGLSAVLLAETIRIAERLGALQVVLAVDQKNDPATASYRRLGWRDMARESVWGRRVSP